MWGVRMLVECVCEGVYVWVCVGVCVCVCLWDGVCVSGIVCVNLKESEREVDGILELI